jgi:hypothetical protein
MGSDLAAQRGIDQDDDGSKRKSEMKHKTL